MSWHVTRKIGRRPRAGVWLGSLKGHAPKFHLTPTIEIDLFYGVTLTAHWLGVHAWVKPWVDWSGLARLEHRAWLRTGK